MTAVTLQTLLNEASSLNRQGRIAEAIAAYEQLLARWPDLPDSWYTLAMLQRKARQFTQALSSYQNALDRRVTKPEEVHLNRAVIYSDYLQQHAEAERELSSALALNANYVPALLNLANLHEDLGRREAALGVYERILRFDPHCLEALARYSHLKVFESADDPLIGQLQCSIASTGVGAAERASLGFALGRALDSSRAFAAAFGAYAAANRASRDSVGAAFQSYDRPGAERYVERLIRAFPATSAVVACGANAPQPIFVCGMFRSGSTLIEQVLAGHPQVAAGGELDLMPHIAQHSLAPFPESMMSVSPERLAALSADYLSNLARLFPGAEYVTDKRPDNFWYIGLIKRLFPNAKIVHTTRDALDNCLSIFFLHLDQRMSYALDLMDIGHHYRQYLRMMAHWKALYGADIHDVKYDSFVHAPEKVARQLLEFLGLKWDERCLAPPAAGRAIKTSSVWQVREPLHRRSSGRAQHYVKELRALHDYLSGTA